MRSQSTLPHLIRPQLKPRAGSDCAAAGFRAASSAAVAAVGWTLSRAFREASGEQLRWISPETHVELSPVLSRALEDPNHAQVDWANFDLLSVRRARRMLSGFVMTLSYSRALYVEFFFNQTLENFLRGSVHALEAFGGAPCVILYDHLKSAVLERRGKACDEEEL